jgi:prepilin-type N-terminal cleavage/methylation domain-containing protein
MARFSIARLHQRFASEKRESGFTLVEMMIAALIFGIFVSILIVSIVGISRASTRAQVVARSTSSLLAVFQDFDHQIRYADSVNFPGNGASGMRYIEYRIPSSSSATGITLCGQWRYNSTTGVLEYRQWQDVTGATASTWATKLTGIKYIAGSNYPFQLIPASVTGASNQQLILTLEAGSAAFTSGAAISTEYVALNSSLVSPSNAQTVTAGVSDTPVCLATGNRP